MMLLPCENLQEFIWGHKTFYSVFDNYRGYYTEGDIVQLTDYKQTVSFEVRSIIYFDNRIVLGLRMVKDEVNA